MLSLLNLGKKVCLLIHWKKWKPLGELSFPPLSLWTHRYTPTVSLAQFLLISHDHILCLMLTQTLSSMRWTVLFLSFILKWCCQTKRLSGPASHFILSSLNGCLCLLALPSPHWVLHLNFTFCSSSPGKPMHNDAQQGFFGYVTYFPNISYPQIFQDDF